MDTPTDIYIYVVLIYCEKCTNVVSLAPALKGSECLISNYINMYEATNAVYPATTVNENINIQSNHRWLTSHRSTQ